MLGRGSLLDAIESFFWWYWVPSNSANVTDCINYLENLLVTLPQTMMKHLLTPCHILGTGDLQTHCFLWLCWSRLGSTESKVLLSLCLQPTTGHTYFGTSFPGFFSCYSAKLKSCLRLDSPKSIKYLRYGDLKKIFDPAPPPPYCIGTAIRSLTNKTIYG